MIKGLQHTPVHSSYESKFKIIRRKVSNLGPWSGLWNNLQPLHRRNTSGSSVHLNQCGPWWNNNAHWCASSTYWNVTCHYPQGEWHPYYLDTIWCRHYGILVHSKHILSTRWVVTHHPPQLIPLLSNFGVKFLLNTGAINCTLTQSKETTSVALTVWVDSIRCIHPPLHKNEIFCLQRQWW